MTRADNIGSDHPFPWHTDGEQHWKTWAVGRIYDANKNRVASRVLPAIAETIVQAVNQWAERWFQHEEMLTERRKLDIILGPMDEGDT